MAPTQTKTLVQLQRELHEARSDSEDDLVASTTASRNIKAGATRNTTTANKKSTTMPARRAGTTAAAAKRKALKDRTNIPEEAQDGEKPKRAKTAASRNKQLGVIPETQPDPVDDVEQSIEGDEMDVTTAPTPPPAQRFAQRARSASVQPLHPRPSARSVSAQPGYPPPRERSGSASGTERERRGGDPELRRKVNEMTKKYEDLNLKYQNLQEIGRNSAESNFEKLKRASDQKAKDASELIASLKKEIAELKKGSSTTGSDNSGTLQKQVTSLSSEKDTLTTDNANMKSQLQVSQNEVKSLEAKLVAARQQLSHSNDNTKTAATTSSQSANLSDAQKDMKMKENLYSDLTGLIIRGVKRKEGEDEYDCIQTGRNGTLHFHLSVANDSSIANPKTPSGLSYEEAEFAYEPFLDESRDRQLLDILPDYLAEEICFPRSHAVKFYTKVVDSMTKKIVVEDE